MDGEGFDVGGEGGYSPSSDTGTTEREAPARDTLGDEIRSHVSRQKYSKGIPNTPRELDEERGEGTLVPLREDLADLGRRHAEPA